MKDFTLDIQELKEKWMKFYLNICLLQSHNPKAKAILGPFKDKIMMFNEDAMAFFDKMEEKQ